MAEPVAQDDFFVVDEDGLWLSATDPYGNILGNDSDPGSDALVRAHIRSGPENGTLLDDGYGNLRYTPDEGFGGIETLTYQAEDSYGALSDPATIEINVVANQGPLSVITRENQPYAFNDQVQVDEDFDGPVSVTLWVEQGFLTFGEKPEGVEFDSEGSNYWIDGDPEAVNAFLATMVYHDADEYGIDRLHISTSYGDSPSPIEDEVEIRIALPTDVVEAGGNNSQETAQDLDPSFVIAADPDVEDSETTPHVTVFGAGNDDTDWYRFTVTEDGPVIIDIDYGFTDSEGGPTSFDGVVALVDGEGNVVEPDQTGDDSDPDPGSFFNDDPYLVFDELAPGTYFVRVEEDDDGSGGPIRPGGTYQLSITAERNQGPVARDDARTVQEPASNLAGDALFTGNVLDNDLDPDNTEPPRDGLTVSAVNGSADSVGRAIRGTFGTLTLAADGSYSYALNNTNALIEGETGTDVFTYTAEDSDGDTDAAELTFTVVGQDLTLTTSGAFIAHRGADEITGGNAADRFAGRAGNDILRTNGGDDTAWGESGDDRLSTGSGDDQGVGGSGNDRMWLGDGEDTGWGGSGNDTIYGEAGNDSVVGDGGNDTLFGGAGADRVFGKSRNDQLILGSGNDRGFGGSGNDRLWGDSGNDELSGDDGDDMLAGGSGNDRMWGEEGNDRLFGGFGADQFSGGPGNDRLFMDAGNDVAWGGADADRFTFTPGFGEDRIKDFGGADRIVFDGVFSSFAEVEDNMDRSGSHIVITAPGAGNTVTVEFVASLDESDFLLV